MYVADVLHTARIGAVKVLIAHLIELLPSVWEVMGLIPARDSEFSLSHACVIISSLFII